MSVFSGEQTMATNNDNQDQEDANQDFLKKVVEVKGDHWSDPQTLAKGYLSAQQYIQDLERQTKEMREDLSKATYSKELLEQLRAQREPTPTAETKETGDTTKENTTPKFSEDELKSLVAETLGKLSSEEKQKQNLSTVDSGLTELYGDKANSVIETKSKELGISKNRMKELAAESPSAFFRLIGAEQPKPRQGSIQSTVNTSAESFNNSMKRDFQYYQKLRRERPNEYYKPTIQAAMMEDRVKLGEAFYS